MFPINVLSNLLVILNYFTLYFDTAVKHINLQLYRIHCLLLYIYTPGVHVYTKHHL